MAVLFDCLDFYGLCASYSSYSFYSISVPLKWDELNN